MTVGKKIWKFISSMKFAIILLVILTLACSVGSLVTQGQSYDWYAARYSDRTAALIIALHLDDAFHSWWFVLITAFLCLNLLLCNVIRLPQLIRRTRQAADPEPMAKKILLYREQRSQAAGEDIAEEDSVEEYRAEENSVEEDRTSDNTILQEPLVSGMTAPEELFSRLHVPRPKEVRTENGADCLFSQKNQSGLWGAWVCHLGILLLIAGFGLGQMTKEEYTVYGLPGQTKDIGDTGLVLTIDDFLVDLREDDTVNQYTADITVRDVGASGQARSESASISVNNPASLFGMKFYQNSTGWAARVTIKKDGEFLQETTMCTGEYVPVKDKPELVIYLNAFYPDYVLENGTPATRSGQINNPAYLYMVYYNGSMLGMNALMQDEDLTIDEYTVNFSDPQNYTLIQIKKDSFTWLALAGGLLTMLGLILAFYLLPVQVCAVQDADGTWTVLGSCRKGGSIFRDRFLAAARQTGTAGHI